MNIDLRFPVYISARPRRGKSERDVVCSVDWKADIPELPMGETDVVFENGNGELVVNHEGRIYRRISEGATSFPTAFNERYLGIEKPFMVNERERASAPASAIHGEHDWRAALTSVGHSRQGQWWPEPKSGPERYDFNRGDILFEEERSKLATISATDYDLAFDMIRRQSERLRHVGSEIWYETAPPVLMVDDAKDHREGVHFVRIRPVFLPEGGPEDIRIRYFHINDLDGAMEYAHFRARYLDHPIVQAPHPGYDAADDEAFAYDTRAEVARKFSINVVQGVSRHLAQNEGFAERETAETLEAVRSGMEELLKTNNVLGTKGDALDQAHILLPVWRNLKRPTYVCNTYLTGEARKALEEDCVSALDETPIAILGPATPNLRY